MGNHKFSLISICIPIAVWYTAVKMENRFTAVFQKTGKWWIAFVDELPGANTQGETIDEARGNLKEAVELIVNRDEILTEENMKAILDAMAEREKGHYYKLEEVFGTAVL